MHVPVLLNEVLDGLNLSPNDSCIDGTVGGGGHAGAILQAISPSGKLIGFDRDQASLAKAAAALEQFGERFIPLHDSYANIADHMDVIAAAGPIKGILLDLGLSSLQLEDRERGFSFQHADAPLDMRFDQAGAQETAADILNTRSSEELKKIFQEYGEVRSSGRLAQAVVKRREEGPFNSVGDLVEVTGKILRPPRGGRSRINPATTVFQALRIAVNDELGQLERFLPEALELLEAGGRMAIISFHSLEDRMVKHWFRLVATDCICPPEIPECRCEHKATAEIVTKKPITATEKEIETNLRSRSAKLRIIQKK
ncbi:16S rRNA (cytosine(1402)-N(4))-methyltransferase RsmH [Patescibacteria group bacterium]